MFQRSAVVDISLVLPKRTRTYAYLICYAGSKLEAHMLVHLPSLMSDTKRHLHVPKLTWMAVALNYAMRLMAWPKAVFPLRGSMPSCSCDAPPRFGPICARPPFTHPRSTSHLGNANIKSCLAKHAPQINKTQAPKARFRRVWETETWNSFYGLWASSRGQGRHPLADMAKNLLLRETACFHES